MLGIIDELAASVIATSSNLIITRGGEQTMAQQSISASERFWSYVSKSNECWLWTGGKQHGGYGHFNIAFNVHASAHRFAWSEVNGPVPKGMCVLHKCDVRDCVNPDHLFLGTNDDNVADKMAKGRYRCLVGESHPNAKLTTADVERMRVMYANGSRQKDLGELFGISRTHVSDVVNKKSRSLG